MTALQVDLHGERIGAITGDNRAFDFQFDAGVVARFGAGSAALSVGMLVAHPLTRTHRQRRQTFFEELVPEGRNREWLCSQAGLAYGDLIGILRRYGRDIAGAIEVWDPVAPGEPRTPSAVAVNDAQIGQTLRDMASIPLGNLPGRGASSVAGVQAKVLLARLDGTWNRAIDGYPSTHILKPADATSPATLIWDEEYGARLARRLELASHETTLETFDGTPALVVERYDRDPFSPDGRVHQEDFNQALGASGHQKYQRSGGVVSLVRIAEVVRAHCGSKDLTALARRTVLAVALGDLDMHAKNLALLHPRDNVVRLAPAYDVVPLAQHGSDGEMALAIAGEYRHAALTRDHLVEEARSWRVIDADAVVDVALDEIVDAVAHEAPLPGAWPGLHDRVLSATRALIEGRAIGDATS